MENNDINRILEFVAYYSNNQNLNLIIDLSFLSEYVLRLKNGSKIHIKKKNKGKFTSWCGGKVTEECIRKGKNSSNPVIRKRANFAANSRKWKH